MKRQILTTMIALTLTTACGVKKDTDYRKARAKGAETKLLLKLTDDAGHSVSNANINIFMGMNFRPNGYYITATPTAMECLLRRARHAETR